MSKPITATAAVLALSGLAHASSPASVEPASPSGPDDSARADNVEVQLGDALTRPQFGAAKDVNFAAAQVTGDEQPGIAQGDARLAALSIDTAETGVTGSAITAPPAAGYVSPASAASSPSAKSAAASIAASSAVAPTDQAPAPVRLAAPKRPSVASSFADLLKPYEGGADAGLAAPSVRQAMQPVAATTAPVVAPVVVQPASSAPQAAALAAEMRRPVAAPMGQRRGDAYLQQFDAGSGVAYVEQVHEALRKRNARPQLGAVTAPSPVTGTVGNAAPAGSLDVLPAVAFGNQPSPGGSSDALVSSAVDNPQNGSVAVQLGNATAGLGTQ